MASLKQLIAILFIQFSLLLTADGFSCYNCEWSDTSSTQQDGLTAGDSKCLDAKVGERDVAPNPAFGVSPPYCVKVAQYHNGNLVYVYREGLTMNQILDKYKFENFSSDRCESKLQSRNGVNLNETICVCSTELCNASERHLHSSAMTYGISLMTITATRFFVFR